MHWPITVPSSTLSAANSVVVPLRLSSCVIVPARPFLSGSPGWVRSSAWIWLFSSTARTGPGDRGTARDQLLGETGVVGDLERLHQMRLEAMSGPDPLDAAWADADRFGHRPRTPVCRVGWAFRHGLGQHLVDYRRRQRRLARRTGLVAQQTRDALIHEALLPAPDRRLGLPGPPHN